MVAIGPAFASPYSPLSLIPKKNQARRGKADVGRRCHLQFLFNLFLIFYVIKMKREIEIEREGEIEIVRERGKCAIRESDVWMLGCR